MEREKFEASWRNAFENAEISPSEKVWTNIELDLEKEKGGHLKRRLLFYQMLAAASVVFAMAIGGVGFYYNFNQPPSSDIALQSPKVDTTPETSAQDNIAQAQVESSASSKDTSPAETTNTGHENSSAKILRSQADVFASDNQADPVHAGKSTLETHPIDHLADGAAPETGSVAMVAHREAMPELPTQVDDERLSPLYTPRRVQLTIPSKDEAVDPVVAMMARLERRERELQGQESKKSKASNHEKLWTSLGFAAGAFNSNQSSSSGGGMATATALAAPIVDQETKASGYAYSMGLNVGTRLAERWVLQGGVNYLTQASEYTATNVVVSNTNYQQMRFRAASTNELVNADAQDLSNKLVYSAPYNVNNSMRYLSVPLQAGYLLVNKVVGVQLNAGVATDLFLQNTVTPDSDLLEKTTQSVGSDSPYRSVNFSGLFGTEVSYRFGEHYRISLNPGIRYPFNTIYKSQLGVQSNPLTFDVGLRFRYIFR